MWSSGGPRGVGGGGGLGAIASHEAHAHAPTCAAFVPGNRTGCGAALVASADAGGALHVWRADTGETVAKLREPGASRTRAGFGFGVGRATPRDAARLRGAHVNANADTTTGASTFTRRLSDASPPGIRSGSPRRRHEDFDGDASSDFDGDAAAVLVVGPLLVESPVARARVRHPGRGVSRPGVAVFACVRSLVAVGGDEDVFSDDVVAPIPTSSTPRSASLSSPVVGYACAAFAPAPANEERSRWARPTVAFVSRTWAPENWRRVGRRAGSRRDGSRRLFPRGRGRGRGRGRDPIAGWVLGTGPGPWLDPVPAPVLSVGRARGRAAGFVGLLDRRDGHLVSGFFAHDGAVTAAAASADGTRFVTAGADRTVACWDARALASSVGGGHKRARSRRRSRV